MSQHDYNIANGGGAAVRADINNALLAILSQNSGATAPTTTKPFMLWYDTANAVIKMRNAADTGWIDYMNSSGQLVAPTATGLITALGGQIKFPATQNASSDANTLDDYEEGTWTPSVRIGGVTTGITYSVQVGAYVKVGGVCTVSGYVLLSSKGGLTGSVVFTGLPFSTRNLTNNYPAPSIGAYGGLTGITAYGVSMDLGPNATSASFLYGSGTACSSLQGSNITNSFTYEFTFSYPTN